MLLHLYPSVIRIEAANRQLTPHDPGVVGFGGVVVVVVVVVVVFVVVAVAVAVELKLKL